MRERGGEEREEDGEGEEERFSRRLSGISCPPSMLERMGEALLIAEEREGAGLEDEGTTDAVEHKKRK